jgi:hypothetical protein
MTRRARTTALWLIAPPLLVLTGIAFALLMISATDRCAQWGGSAQRLARPAVFMEAAR